MRFIWLFFIIHFVSLAQKNNTLLSEIELVDYKFKPSISKTDTIEKKDNSQISLAEQLTKNSTIFIKNYGLTGISTISFRGTTSSQSQVLWNGIPLNSITLGQADLSIINSSSNQSIEITTGEDGINSYPGAIGANILLKDELHDNQFKFKSTFGSYGLLSHSIDFSKIYDKIKFGFSWNRLESSNSFKFYNPFTQSYQKREKSRINSGNLKLTAKYYPKKNTELSFGSWYSNSKKELPNDISSSFFINSFSEDLQLRNYLKFHKINKNGNTQIQYSNQLQNYTYSDTSSSIYNKVHAEQHFVHFKRSLSFKKISFTLSHESEFSQVKTLNFFKKEKYNFNHSHLRIGYVFSEKYSFEYVMSFLNRSNFTSKALHSLTLSKKSNKYNLFIKSKTNIRYPTLNDLFWKNSGNKNLLPEESWQNEIGLNFSFKKIDISTQVYFNKIKNQIQWVPNENNIWRPENFLQVQSTGLDLKLKTPIINNKLKLHSNIGFNKTIDRKTKMNIIYTPSLKIKNTLEFQKSDYKILLNNTYQSKVYITRDNNSYMPWFFLWDFVFVKKNKKTNINYTLGIYNLLNTNYQIIANNPLPKRNLRATIELAL